MNIALWESLYNERCEILRKLEGVDLSELNNYENFKDIFDKSIFKELMNRKQNRKNKRYRVKNKILEMYQLSFKMKNPKMVFGTLTLDDQHLNLKEDTYIREIHKWLKKHFVYVILNKDFGKKTEREHYHFIGLTVEQLEDKNVKSKKGYKIYELIKKDYKLGFEPGICLIDLNKRDLNQTINYLLKLNNHTTKSSTKSRIRVIVSPLVKVLFYKTKMR